MLRQHVSAFSLGRHQVKHPYCISTVNIVKVQMELFHQPTLMHTFLYSLTICLLHYYPQHVTVTNILLKNKDNFALKLVDEIILYYDARLKKLQSSYGFRSSESFEYNQNEVFQNKTCTLCCQRVIANTSY